MGPREISGLLLTLAAVAFAVLLASMGYYALLGGLATLLALAFALSIARR